jgi:hypothetical protein
MFAADDTPVSEESVLAHFLAAAFGAEMKSRSLVLVLASARLAAGTMEIDGCISSD